MAGHIVVDIYIGKPKFALRLRTNEDRMKSMITLSDVEVCLIDISFLVRFQTIIPVRKN